MSARRVCRYRPQGGHYGASKGEVWLFTWQGDLLEIRMNSAGWALVLPNSREMQFVELWDVFEFLS